VAGDCVAAVSMSLLRIRSHLTGDPLKCQWVWIGSAGKSTIGEGLLSEVPKRAKRVQLIIPAAQVLLTRVRLPDGARRQTGLTLAFAVEEEILPEPELNHVSLIGPAGDQNENIVAVIDKKGLKQCLEAFDAAAIRADEVYCETLLLPWMAGRWSLAWDGSEGFLRTGEFEGVATDCGDSASPPLCLQLMLKAAERHDEGPDTIVLYPTAMAEKAGFTREAAGDPRIPDLDAWQRELGIPIQLGGDWDWHVSTPTPNARLMQVRKRWPNFFQLLPGLRPAAQIMAGALAIHSVALIADWTLLAEEQHKLRQQMEARFRGIFPKAVAVVDPALQMRRKLVEARHAAGVTDMTDFLPMLETVAAGLAGLPTGSLKAVSYENGMMVLELGIDEAPARDIAARLQEDGLHVDIKRVSAKSGESLVALVVGA
jgi:general secretion pathway protein L